MKLMDPIQKKKKMHKPQLLCRRDHTIVNHGAYLRPPKDDGCIYKWIVNLQKAILMSCYGHT